LGERREYRRLDGEAEDRDGAGRVLRGDRSMKPSLPTSGETPTIVEASAIAAYFLS
jgi:hypothetical protein